MEENEISYTIRGCIFRVFNELGPGLLESAYITALTHEMTKAGLIVESEIAVPMIYDGIKHNHGFRLDLLVNEKVIVEVKSLETVLEVHHKQVITYLKLTGLKLALLVNFNTADISKSIFRKVNGL